MVSIASYESAQTHIMSPPGSGISLRGSNQVSVKTNRSRGFRSDGLSGVEDSMMTSTTLVMVPWIQLSTVKVRKRRETTHLCELFAHHLSDATDVLPKGGSARLPYWHAVRLHLLEHLWSREEGISSVNVHRTCLTRSEELTRGIYST